MAFVTHKRVKEEGRMPSALCSAKEWISLISINERVDCKKCLRLIKRKEPLTPGRVEPASPRTSCSQALQGREEGDASADSDTLGSLVGLRRECHGDSLHEEGVMGMDIRRGDLWEFTTNNGVIVRHVRSVASGVVSYFCNGVMRQCSVTCFRRWAKGAELTFADNWTGRTETRKP